MPGLAAGEEQRSEDILAGDLDAPDGTDQVIARRAFAHALGQHLADNVAGGDAEARITLDEKGVGPAGQRANLRKQIGAYRHRAAPGQIDLHLGEVGKDLQHQLAIPGLEVLWNVLDQGGGRAEQQPVLVGHPVVVDHRTDIAVGPSNGADSLDEFFRQRFGDDLKGVGVDGGAMQLRFQLVEKAVAGPEQLAGGDRAASGTHLYALAIADVQHRAELEDAHPETGRCLGFAQQ